MKRFFVTLVVSLLLSWSAFAHSPLQETSPNDGAKLEAMPTEVTFTFKRNMRLTKVTSTQNGSDTINKRISGCSFFLAEKKLRKTGNAIADLLMIRFLN